MLDAVNVLCVMSKETTVVSEFVQEVMKRGGLRPDRKPRHVTDHRVKAISVDRRVVDRYIKRSSRRHSYGLKIRNFEIIIRLAGTEAIIRNSLPAFTEISAPLMTTTFFVFCKCDLKADIVVTSLLLNGCVISILWKTFEGAGRVDFFDFTTRGDFFEGSCLPLRSLSLAVLRFDMVEISLQGWQGPV